MMRALRCAAGSLRLCAPAVVRHAARRVEYARGPLLQLIACGAGWHAAGGRHQRRDGLSPEPPLSAPYRSVTGMHAVREVLERRGQRAAGGPYFQPKPIGPDRSHAGSGSSCGAGRRGDDAGSGRNQLGRERRQASSGCVFSVSALHREGPNNGCRAARCR